MPNSFNPMVKLYTTRVDLNNTPFWDLCYSEK